MKQSLLNASASTSSVKTKLAWRAAGDLRPGDRVVTKDGRVGVVKATKPVGQLSTVHNFAVEDTHTYFVGTGPGVWVHNIYKPRVLTKQAELSPADVVKSEALAERYKQATQGLEGQDKNLAGMTSLIPILMKTIFLNLILLPAARPRAPFSLVPFSII